jgi:excinuclease ABC subunit A
MLVADAYSYNTGEKMVSYSDEQIKDLIIQDFSNKRSTFQPLLFGLEKGIMERIIPTNC